MSTPRKRRKLEDDAASPSNGRSLDFFFTRQKEKNSSPGQRSIGRQISKADGLNNDSVTVTSTLCSDEELARKLQQQWEEEDRGLQTSDRPGGNDREECTTHAVEVRGGGEVLEGRKDVCIEHLTAVSSPQDGRDCQPEVQKSTTTREAKKDDTLALQSAKSEEDIISSTIAFDQSPLEFDPLQYAAGLKASWDKHEGRASYALLTRCFVLVNSTQSRIKIVDTLVNLLRTIIEVDPESLLAAVWLTTNAISPPYISLELGLGGSAISKALKKTCMLDNAGLKSLYDKHGDAGDVAFEAKKRQTFTLRKPKPLSIQAVYDSLVKVANSKGTGSQEFKQRIVERLLQDAQGAEESRYLVRTLCQHLRIGAVKTTMLIALSRAFLLSRPPSATFEVRSRIELQKYKKEGLVELNGKAEELVKACFARCPNYNILVPCLLQVGVTDELLARCDLALHVPLRPMLGSITRDLGEMLTKLQGRDFSCEYKYDGQRAQVHCDAAGKVSIFSRHLEVMTDKYPDLVALVPQIRGESVSSFILEGEVVAIDPETGQLKAFQTLTNRAKKDVAISAITVNVCLFSFDLMYLNGESLLDRPFRERRSLLRSLFVEIPNRFTWVKSLDATSADSETVLEFFKSATEVKCEGIMVKVLDNEMNTSLPSIEQGEFSSANDLLPPTEVIEYPKTNKPKKTGPKQTNQKEDEKTKGSRRKALLATYEPDKRLDSWLKVKKDYNTSADTIDLIPIAAWHGQGRKSKWWSPILLAVRNPSTGSLEAVTKCISGFTDQFYKDNKARYNEETGHNIIARPGYIEYPGNPDVWFEPQEVWEMAFADITKSPTYLAAIGLIDPDRGLSMRFPRFLKTREDKSIEEASTADFLADLWLKQEAKGSSGEKVTKIGQEGDDDDEN